MGLLQEAIIEQAAAKIGIFGPQGSGKSLTAFLILVGLSKVFHNNAPIAMMDTENGSDYLVEIAKAEGVPFKRFKSRAFKDMRTGLTEAEEAGCCGYLVDSYTHPWTEVNEALRKKKGVKKLQMHHLDELKTVWRTWTDMMLNSNLHVIVSGRLGYVWDKEEDEEGMKTELVKLGTKMKSENEAGYEPSLLVELEGIQDDGARRHKSRTKRGTISHHAYVLKDRWRDLNGRTFTWRDLNDYEAGDYEKVFKVFRPHFDHLVIGQNVQQRGINTTRTSESLFVGGDTPYGERMRRVTIALEEIQGLLVDLWPSQDAVAKDLKRTIIRTVFGTRSWTKVSNMSIETLDDGLASLRRFEAGVTQGGQQAALTDPTVAASYVEMCAAQVAAQKAEAENTIGVL